MWAAIAFAGSVVALVVVLVRGTARTRRPRELATTPLWPIAELPDATVGLVIGDAASIALHTIDAPLSGERCLYYHLRIVELAEGRPDRTLAEHAEGVPFTLDDGTARAVVDPSGAICALAPAKTRHVYASQLDGRVLAILQRTHRWIRPHAHLVLREARVAPGARIAVIARGSRSEARLELASSRHAPLVLSDETEPPKITLPAARVRQHRR